MRLASRTKVGAPNRGTTADGLYPSEQTQAWPVLSDGRPKVPWPYMPSQCSTCRYFQAFEPAAEDDAGYRLPGFCGHPQIGMELFVPRDRPEIANATCRLRWPRQPSASDAS